MQAPRNQYVTNVVRLAVLTYAVSDLHACSAFDRKDVDLAACRPIKRRYSAQACPEFVKANARNWNEKAHEDEPTMNDPAAI